MLCICSPAGQEKFFMEVGVPVRYAHHSPTETRTNRTSRIHRKSESTCPQVPHRTAERGIRIEAFFASPTALVHARQEENRQ